MAVAAARVVVADVFDTAQDSQAHTGTVLIVAPHGSYRTQAFIAAAGRIGVNTLIASQGKHSVVSAYAQGIHIDFRTPDAALQALLHAAQQHDIAGVIGTDDGSTELAAQLAQQLRLPHNDPAAVRLARRKDLARAQLARHGVNKPAHQLLDLQAPLLAQRMLDYPVVIKPLALSASQGVIRADDDTQFIAAVTRVQHLLQALPDLEPHTRRYVLLEQFVPGAEIAVEGMLCAGRLHILAVFDKPDPLEGPFFEETYYITPSRLLAAQLDDVSKVIQAACDAYGLREGPVHAELRINAQGVFVLEVAARTIGGMCGRLLRFGTGYSLEELVLAHATGRALPAGGDDGAAGVLMIPIPQAGILKRIEGLLDTQRVPFIEDIDIQIREGHELVPLPEGNSYLGFIFARAPTPQQAEQALRDAHARLNIVVAPLWRLKQCVA